MLRKFKNTVAGTRKSNVHITVPLGVWRSSLLVRMYRVCGMSAKSPRSVKTYERSTWHSPPTSGTRSTALMVLPLVAVTVKGGPGNFTSVSSRGPSLQEGTQSAMVLPESSTPSVDDRLTRSLRPPISSQMRATRSLTGVPREISSCLYTSFPLKARTTRGTGSGNFDEVAFKPWRSSPLPNRSLREHSLQHAQPMAFTIDLVP
mmetsp:Transcript_12541/g.34673  ORF Transcript_12541/g.34673 Transcript_12541/m.34673 type:complete len:204 (+) Transcript_12541:428-1039(+)